jgi:hypothetical protein
MITMADPAYKDRSRLIVTKLSADDHNAPVSGHIGS